MGLKYYSKNINNSKNFPLLSSNVDIPSYANTSISNYKKYQNSSQLLSSKTNINTYPYISIQNHDNIDHSIQTSYDFQNNTYANISKSQIKSTYISNETILENATSMTSLSNTEIEINLDIIDKNNNNNNNQIYENIKLCPKLLSSINPFKLNKLLLYQKSSIDNINSCSSSHNYINLQQQSINPIHTILSRKNDQKEKKHCSSIDSLKKEHVDIETNSNTNTTQIVKKLEVNLAPSCRDKSVLYRTKIPSSFHQQQIMHRSKRHSTRPFYANQNSNKIKQQVSNSNIPLHHPIITDDQWKRSIHKNRQMKSVSNQLYNEIQQSIYSDNQSLNSIYIEKDLCENPMEFHKILQDQIFAWYPTENYNEEDLITQTHSILENDESDKQNEITNLDEEELYRHDTFEDFFLRRRRKSSSSSSSHSTLVNDNKTILSETISHEIPIKNSSLNRHFPSIALGLDKTDVEFIHDIIERSNGDHHRSNRITALREAYIRARNKKLDLIKTKNNSSINENKKKHIKPIKHSFVTSKIRDELEKYDELPVYQRTSFNDDDDDDDIYSVNYQQHIHHCTIPAIVSTVHRISNFISSLKRQLQKNFHNIQSRILIENMSKSSNHISRHRRTFHNSSGHPHRHISRPKTMHNIVHHSNEHSHPIHRRQFHSNRSQLQHQHSHQFPSYEQHSSHRKRTFRIIPHQQRLQRIE